jgi:predicted DCC family thiol-disulfide oxidoreductase YuxK
MGWIYAATKLPLIGKIADWLYGIWADWRLKLTGRPDLQTILTEQEKQLENNGQHGRCQLIKD